MANKTSFLELTLPLNGEFVDNWDQPINSNFELLDDHLSGLKNDLVSSTGSTSNLKGTKTSLQERIDAGLNVDGSLKLSTADSYTVLENARSYPVSSASDQIKRILDRLHFGEEELMMLRLGTSEDRYGGTSAPSIMAGLRKVLAGYTQPTAQAIPSPVRGFTPDSVVQGQWTAGSSTTAPVPAHLTFTSDEITVQAGSVDSMYNIDGALFEISGNMTLDFTASGHNVSLPMDDGTYHLFVSRNAADYNDSSPQWYYNRYAGQVLSGGPFRLDPRVLPTHAGLRADAASAVSPSDGQVTSGASTLLSSSAEFTAYGVRAGDDLVITSPSSLAGRYIVASSTATTVVIPGKFTASSSSVEFRIERATAPTLGYVSTAGSQPATAGRLYIGNFTVFSGAITAIIPYAPNGLYDTGWIEFTSAQFYVGQKHYLGTVPSQVEILVKGPSGDVWTNPLAQIEVSGIDVAGGSSFADKTVKVPGLTCRMSESLFTVSLTNQLSESYPATVFYDDIAPSDVAETAPGYFARVILRR